MSVTPSTTSPPITPRTPPRPEPSVKVTLPTPSSFSSRRDRSYSIDPASPHSQESTPKGKGHTRSVSFSVESPESPSDDERYTPRVENNEGPKLHRIPQRSQPVSSSAPPTANTFISPPSSLRRMNAPKPLNLAKPISGARLASLSPFSRGPLTAPASRLSSTAASRGISIAPASARGARHSLSGGSGSIWSAGLDAPPGWISPSPNSAQSTGTAARQRGLTVAVLKDGKEMIIGDVPVTPSLSTGGLKSGGLIGSAPFKGSPIMEEHENGSVTSPGSDNKAKKPEVIILCRYYHTPGLTCTSRPCRFVHNLDAIASPKTMDQYQMKSPNADPTGGTFAEAQMKAQAKILKVDELVANGATPGETVVLADEGGKEVRGTVYLMSGGGKGPAGKSRAKFKTVPCKDFAEGYCVYGDYCSFIHDEKIAEAKVEKPELIKKASSASEAESEASQNTVKVKEASSRTSSISKPLDAWTKALPRAVLVPSVAIDSSALEKQRIGLSAFAVPFSNPPVRVDEKGQLVPDETTIAEPSGAQTLFKPKTSPRSSIWASVTPLSLRKVSIVEPSADLGPTSAHLAPPVSAFSMFGTESDPATPWDPALMSRMTEEDSYNHDYDSTIVTPPEPFSALPLVDAQHPWSSLGYPWGIPMSPSSPLGTDDPLAAIPGGPGVMWTPAGWAVQDAAMKLSLRAAQVKAKNEKAHVRGKSYYKTKACKWFNEGDCPHGDSCTYLHKYPGSVPATVAKSHKTKTLPCKFYNSAKGCLNGDDCDFLHQLVVPPSVPLVERPRPWRTKPCRHWQLGRCTLGDACHFAHVRDPARHSLTIASLEKEEKPCRHWQSFGMCSKGFECKFNHGSSDVDTHVSGERLADAFREMKMNRRAHEESDGEDDDVEIVTASHTSFSPAHSVRA